MPGTVLLRVTRTFDVLVDMKRAQVADSMGEREAIKILARDRRFRLKEAPNARTT